MQTNSKDQPWIYSKGFDGFFILLPPFLVLAVLLLFPSYWKPMTQLSPAMWVVLILLVDVSHVYSTLYRTYFDPEMITNHKSLLTNVPLIVLFISIIVFSISPLWFWRIMAYIAVFHFIRQQYGLMRIYSRKDNFPHFFSIIDTLAIYTATIYPILSWHLSGPKTFSWFVADDFLFAPIHISDTVFFISYLLILGMFIVKESYSVYRYGRFNLPKNLLLFGTVLSWYFGIVFFNSDIAFTALNVVSHGIPYMALIWVHGYKKTASLSTVNRSFLRIVFSKQGVFLFVLIIAGFAFVEEGIWDALVWNEHNMIFKAFHFLPQVTSHELLSFIVPLLSLPQITHYVLDGYIWKLRDDNYNWRDSTLI